MFLKCTDPGSEGTFSNSILPDKKEKRDQKAIQEESSSTLVDRALVTIFRVAKDRQGLNPEEVSSTPAEKVKKSKGSEESSSSNARDKKTDTPKEKGNATKRHRSPAR